MANDKVARARSDSPEVESRTVKRRVVSTRAVATRESLTEAASTSKVQKRRESSVASLFPSVASGLRPSPVASGSEQLPRASLPGRTSSPVAATSRSATLSTHSASAVSSSSRLSFSRVPLPVSPSVISVSSDSSSSHSPSPPPSPPPLSRRRCLPARRIPSLSPSSSTSPPLSPSAPRPKRLFGQLRLPTPPPIRRQVYSDTSDSEDSDAEPTPEQLAEREAVRALFRYDPWAPADALVGMGVGAARLAWSDDGMEWEDAGQEMWGMHQAGDVVVLDEHGGRLQEEWVEVRAEVESGNEDESEDGMLQGFEKPGIEDVDEDGWNEPEFLRFEAAEQEVEEEEDEEEEVIYLKKDVGGMALNRRPARRRSISSHLLSHKKEAISQEKEIICIDSDSD